jgi:hypothetical protein
MSFVASRDQRFRTFRPHLMLERECLCGTPAPATTSRGRRCFARSQSDCALSRLIVRDVGRGRIYDSLATYGDRFRVDGKLGRTRPNVWFDRRM